jgi:hypothetical protein
MRRSDGEIGTHKGGTYEKKMPIMSAQIAAGIVVRFTPHEGGCWKILERRVRVESKLLSHCQILTIFLMRRTRKRTPTASRRG